MRPQRTKNTPTTFTTLRHLRPQRTTKALTTNASKTMPFQGPHAREAHPSMYTVILAIRSQHALNHHIYHRVCFIPTKLLRRLFK